MGPDTPMEDIADRCRVWESHAEDMSKWKVGHKTDRPRAVYQVASVDATSRPNDGFQRGFARGGQVGAATSASIQLPGTFLGLGLDLGSNRLYDLMDDIPDVMGLRALRPSVAICKVMSVPDSRCVRVVTPDDHVNIGFHEIIIHDLADEEWPLVTLSDLGCLRLEWPKPLFTFMSRYQFDLDQMRKECRKRFGSTQSGKCTTCGKHIQMNLGKHVTLYHMELAQLWRCPVWWVRSGRGLRRTGWIT